MQLLLTTGRHFTVALWMPVGLSATAGMRSVEEYVECNAGQFVHIIEALFLL
jgi:hypothetical protein